MKTVSDLFEVVYGHSLELNRLTLLSREQGGIAFVSRKMGDNGISAYVAPIGGISPAPAGELTCALSGNGVLSTFLQDEPFYTGFHVARLKPLVEFTKEQLLYYCYCILSNRYRFSYGRQANRTLKDILLPEPCEIPNYVTKANVEAFDGCDLPATPDKYFELEKDSWKPFYSGFYIY